MPLRAAPRLIGAIALDAWLREPAGVIPGNAMTFPGIAEERTRADRPGYFWKSALAAEPGRSKLVSD